eukprot:7532047-Karenia_brevis.AAC.1
MVPELFSQGKLEGTPVCTDIGDVMNPGAHMKLTWVWSAIPILPTSLQTCPCHEIRRNMSVPMSLNVDFQ